MIPHVGFSWDVTLCLVQKTLSSSVFPFSFLQLREAMVAMRKSARDVAKFMDAVSKKTSLQEAQKGVGASRGPLLPKTGKQRSSFPAGKLHSHSLIPNCCFDLRCIGSTFLLFFELFPSRNREALGLPEGKESRNSSSRTLLPAVCKGGALGDFGTDFVLLFLGRCTTPSGISWHCPPARHCPCSP